MSIVQEYLEQRKPITIQHHQNQIKHITSFFGGVVIKSINFYTSYPLFGIKLKMVIMRFLPIGNNVNGNFGSKNKKLINLKLIILVLIKILVGKNVKL
jgi:hypothetical protein